MPSIPRRQYAALYGPTVGDRVRLADTSLLLGIERDLLTHGDEAVFGGAKPFAMVWPSDQMRPAPAARSIW